MTETGRNEKTNQTKRTSKHEHATSRPAYRRSTTSCMDVSPPPPRISIKPFKAPVQRISPNCMVAGGTFAVLPQALTRTVLAQLRGNDSSCPTRTVPSQRSNPPQKVQTKPSNCDSIGKVEIRSLVQRTKLTDLVDSCKLPVRKTHHHRETDQQRDLCRLITDGILNLACSQVCSKRKGPNFRNPVPCCPFQRGSNIGSSIEQMPSPSLNNPHLARCEQKTRG